MTIHGRTQQAGPAAATTPSPGEVQVEPHSLPRSLALHLLPGVVIATIFYGAAPLVMRAGFPAIAAGMLAAVGVLGIEMGWLLYQARRRTGRFALSALLPYRPGRFTWRKGLLAFAIWFWALAASMLLAGLKPVVLGSVFWWVPDWAVNPLPRDIAATSSVAVLVVTGVGLLAVNVILTPLAEEVYFRGYLLPRLHRLGIWAPLVNISLFSLYHYWTPWDVLTRIVLLLPMAYAVWWTRDIRVGMAVHVGLNGTGYFTNSLPTLLAG